MVMRHLASDPPADFLHGGLDPSRSTTDAFRSVVLTATMAPGVNTYIFANMYGVAKRVAATSVLDVDGTIGILTSGFGFWLFP